MSDLSDKVTAISAAYLGPAAKIFLERQTRAHMEGLSFTNLERKHLSDLSKWVLISASLVIDKPKAKELSDKILNIT
jgi:hypothetical protein